MQFLLGGRGWVPGGTHALDRHAGAYQESYEQPNVFGPLGLEFSYLNEGHLSTLWPWYWPVNRPLHYRDAYALQLDAWTPQLLRCRVGLAAGPENYFDTTTSGFRTHYEDRHGVGVRANVAAQCFPIRSLAVEFRAGRSFDVASFDSTTVMIGLSYSPRSLGDSASVSESEAAHAYVDLVAGTTEVDTFRTNQERGIVEWLAYGHAIAGPFAVELSALNEGVSGYLLRRGVAAQLLVSHSFGAPWLRLFAGLGPELAWTGDEVNGYCNLYQPVCDEATLHRYTQVNLLYSYGIRIDLWRRLSALVKIGRTESASGRTDTDIVSAGVSVRLQ